MDPTGSRSRSAGSKDMAEKEEVEPVVGGAKALISMWTKTQIDELQVEPMSHMPSKDQLFWDDGEDKADHFGSRFVMREKNLCRLAWSAVLCVLLAYTGSVFLFRFTFYDFHIGEDGHTPITSNSAVWSVLDGLVDALFWVDLFIIFFFTYPDRKGREVDSLILIAKNYLTFYFWVNLIACIPPPVLQKMMTTGSSDDSAGMDPGVVRVYRLQRISRMTRLARVARLVRLVKFVQIINNSHLWKQLQSFRGMRIMNFITGLMWSVHLLACGWYLCASLHDDETQTWVARRADGNGTSLLAAPPFEQWLVSMYFVLTVFTTVGFGDISATTEAEIIYVAFTMLVGAVVHSIIISEVIGIVTSTDEVQKIISQQTALIEAYSKHTQLAPETTKELKNEIAWRARNWAASLGFDKSEMKNLITGKHVPRWLIAKMPRSLWGGALLKNDLLHIGASVPPRLPCLLAVHLVLCEFVSGETVYQMGDFPFNLFLVISGTFAHVAFPGRNGGTDAMQLEQDEACLGATDSIGGPGHAASTNVLKDKVSSTPSMLAQCLYPYRLFSHNSYFGDTEMIWNKPRFATTRCEKEGLALTLHKADFLEVQDMFPHFRSAWALAARRRERFRAQCLGRLRSGHHYKRLAALQILDFLRRRRDEKDRKKRSQAISQVISKGQSLYITGLQPPLSEARQTQVAVESLRAEIDALRREVREALSLRTPASPSQPPAVAQHL